MQVYIVGGAVRDTLLGKPIKDKDFVVVGTTPNEMIKAGFIQVGADFPVFLHPKTKAEYALARTERKSGKGYKGFEVYAAAEVTLEQDLKRRDLTINAMAIEVKGLFDDTPITGEIIDPYNGKADIEHKILRHVSEAFSEDPLRALRIARFYGRFFDANAEVNFSIAPETRLLIDEIIESGELNQLTPERVWQETSRALMQTAPQAYFDCLMNVDALPQLMPKWADAMQNKTVRELIFNALALAGQHHVSLAQRWAITMSCFAPAVMFSQSTTTNDNLKTDLDHDDSISDFGVTSDLANWEADVLNTSNLFKLPKKITQFAILYAKSYHYLANFNGLKAIEIAEFIQLTKANKEVSDMNDIIVTHNIIQSASQQLKTKHWVAAYNHINMTHIDKDLQGSAIGEALNMARIKAIANIL